MPWTGTTPKQFATKVQTLVPAVFVASAAHAHRSVQEGSPDTGSKGQPVDEGNLRASIQLEFPSRTEALISTNVGYAESNEDGIARPGGGPYIQRSSVGGRWSFALTIAGIQRIVDVEAARLAG